MTQETFFTADEHFDHSNIIKFCKRPFESREDMREQLITRHNSKVTRRDVVYHLGDLFWRTLWVGDALEILKRLNGTHHLILGNHDETAKKMMQAYPFAFASVSDTKLIRPYEQFPAVWLSHYAHRVWPDSHKGSYHLFGHTHAVVPDYRRSHDAGVDANDYFPISLSELDVYMKAKTITPDEVETDMQNNRWDKTGN